MNKYLEVIAENTKHLGKKLLLSSLAFPLLLGCQKDENSINEYNRTKNSQIYENTFILSQEILDKISSVGDNSISFSEQTSKYGIKKGDILIGGISKQTPEGILKEVTGISADKKQILVSDASLEQAVRTGEIIFDQKLDFSNLTSEETTKGLNFSEGKGEYDFNLDFDNLVLYDKDGDSTTNVDRIVLNGGISFSIHPKIKMSFNEEVVSAYFGSEIPGKAYLNIQSKAGEAFLEKEKRILKKKLTPFLIPASPVPIVISPKLEIYAGMEAGTKSNFKVGAEDEFVVSASVNYNKTSNWTSNKNFTNSFDFVTPEFFSDMTSKIYVYPKLTFLVNKLAGPYIKTEGYFKGEVDVDGNPWWSIYGGLEASLGMDMKFLSKYIPNFEKTFYSLDEKISDAHGPLVITNTPPVARINVTPTYYGDTSTEFTLSALSSTDKEDLQSQLTARFDFETNGVWDTEFNLSKLAKHIFSSPGVYQVSVEVKDTKGASDTAFTFIDVKSVQNLEEIVIQPDAINGKDAEVGATISCNSPNSYYGNGNDTIMEVSNSNKDGCYTSYENSLIRFPLTAIPAGSKISSAKFGFYGYATINRVDGIPTFFFSKLNGDWDETNVKWNTKPSSEKFADLDINNGLNWYYLDVTSLVQKWFNDDEQNYGIDISTSKESVFGTIYTSDHKNSVLRPKLIVKYTK